MPLDRLAGQIISIHVPREGHDPKSYSALLIYP